MTWELHRHDARHISTLLEPESVDLVVTSPPYFALRSYRDGGEHYDGQLGSEPTPTEFVDNLIACTADWMTVLKPGGSAWINLGDKYAGSGGGNQSGVLTHRNTAISQVHDEVAASGAPRRYNQASDGIRAKSLMGLPWRYAIRCIDELGLILRAEVVWCLSGGARVYARTATGARPIMLRDLVRAYRPENVELWNGERWTQVLGWNQSTNTDGALELELRSGERIGCTRGHRWPTARGVIRAAEITVGDVIDVCRLPAGQRQPDMLPDDDVGWFVGLYLAEGSRSGTAIQIAGHRDETERQCRLAALAAAYDGTCNVYQTSENGATCNLHAPVLAGILDRYTSPGTAHTKRLTVHAWQRSDDFLAAVVTGYLEGDGHYDAKNDRWRLGFTHNDELAADLRCLAGRLGAVLSLRRNPTGWRGEWRWNVSEHWNARPTGEVVAIRASRARQFFDIGVADDPHLFALASGVLTHNSKPNGLPESVTDRVRRSHENWFHLVKSPTYFAAIDEVREANVTEREWAGKPNGHLGRDGHGTGSMLGRESNPHSGMATAEPNPLGKVPGSVWTIPSEPLVVPDDLGVDHFACVDAETQILTRRGWLNHDQLRLVDEAAGHDFDTGLTRWTRVQGIHRYDYDGDLVSVEARGLSMRLTPNHRTLVHRYAGRHQSRQPVEVIEAVGLTKLHGIPRAVDWIDDGREKAIGVDLAALCSWVAAEGWVTTGGLVYLCQSLTANPEHVATIDALLSRCDAPSADRSARQKYRRTLDGLRRTVSAREWRGRPSTMVTWALPLGLSQLVASTIPGKMLPAEFVDLPLDEARAVLDAFIDADGHRRTDGRMSVFQKHRDNLDVLQMLAVRCGYNTTLSQYPERWVLYINPPRPARLRRADGTSLVGREHYRGVVWCVTTGTATFVARRRGTVFVTGNSFPSELPRRIILGWSPSGYCTACGEARRAVVEKTYVEMHQQSRNRAARMSADDDGFRAEGGMNGREVSTIGANEVTITGYACACTPYTDHPGQRIPASERTGNGLAVDPGNAPRQTRGSLGNAPRVGPWREYHHDQWTPAPTRPAVVLDPFVGTGTTVAVAHHLGRHGIGTDLSADYLRLAEWRCTSDRRLRDKVLDRTGIPNPKPPVINGQLDMFDEATA